MVSGAVGMVLLLVPSTEMTMRLLIATARTQGYRSDDYFTAREGELVWVPEPCPGAIPYPGAPLCACSYSFGGVESGGATTSALIVESDLSRRELVRAFVTGSSSNEWSASRPGECVDQMLAAAGRWPTGTVIGRRFARFELRPEWRAGA
jgi:hypothetical protein